LDSGGSRGSIHLDQSPTQSPKTGKMVTNWAKAKEFMEAME
jgi:hypothetical protein